MNIINEVAVRLKDPDNVSEQIIRQAGSYWQPLSLSHGYPGPLVLFATLDELFPEESWDTIAHRYVLKIKERIEAGDVNDLSLFGGLAGSCFAIQQASRGKTRYQKLLKSLNEYLFKGAQKTYLVLLYEKIELGLPANPSTYDIISGITGIGVYALSNLDDALASSFLYECLRIIVALTKDLHLAAYTLPGWYVPRHYQFTDLDKQQFPKGNFNLGLAHGMTGLLAFLSTAVCHGIVVDGQLEAITKLTQWLQSHKSDLDGNVYWKNHISFEEAILKTEEKATNNYMDAWCYGTAGIARTLYIAGTALKNAEIQHSALNVFLQMLYRIDFDCPFLNPSFCHGIAGLLTINTLMARETNSAELHGWTPILEKTILQHYNHNLSFGFKDKDFSFNLLYTQPNRSNQETVHCIETDKIGMLEGTSGILLSLMSSKLENLSWTNPFLIRGKQ